MSQAQKEKFETGISIHLLPEKPEENNVTLQEDYIEVALEKKRKDANKPLYLKRI
jgi:hypothetical protein